MNTYLKEGKSLSYSNSGSAITSGSPVVLLTGNAGFLGIAKSDIAATTGVGDVAVAGVHRLPCLSTDVGAMGVPVYWDAGNSRLTVTASTNTWAGRLAKPKANGETTADFILNQK